MRALHVACCFLLTTGWGLSFGSPKTRWRRASQAVRLSKRKDFKKPSFALNNAKNVIRVSSFDACSGLNSLHPAAYGYRLRFRSASARVIPALSVALFSRYFASSRTARCVICRAVAMAAGKSVHDRCRVNAA